MDYPAGRSCADIYYSLIPIIWEKNGNPRIRGGADLGIPTSIRRIWGGGCRETAVSFS